MFLLSLTSVLAPQEVVPYLADADCNREVVIAELDGARVYGSCSTENGERILQITVENLAADKGPLAAFGLGFCGTPVIGAAAPSDWTADTATTDEKTTVNWKHPGWPAPTAGVSAGMRLGGFSVRLRRGWQRSTYFKVAWAVSVSSSIGFHDCPAFTFGRSRKLWHSWLEGAL